MLELPQASVPLVVSLRALVWLQQPVWVLELALALQRLWVLVLIRVL